MHRFFTAILVITIVVSLAGCASSTKVVRGSEARQLVGDGLELLEPGEWSATVIRDRRAGILLAAIFAPGEATFRPVKRQLLQAQSNPYNLIVINDPKGEKGFAPSPQLLGEIREAKLVPEVILGPEGNREALIYRNPGQSMNASIQKDGSIRVELGRRQDRGGSLAYSLPIYGVATPAPAVGPTPIESADGLALGEVVSWTDSGVTRVGTVRIFKGDGTCLVNMLTENGLEEIIVPQNLLLPIGESSAK